MDESESANSPSELSMAGRRGKSGSVGAHVQSWVHSSTVLERVTDVLEDAPRAIETSTSFSVCVFLTTVVRNSWLYIWLTAEPESKVTVIDLRDTRTLGPVLGFLDRISDPGLAVLVRSSTYKLVRPLITAPRDFSTRDLGLALVVAALWSIGIGTVLGIYVRVNLYLSFGLVSTGMVLYRWNVRMEDLPTTEVCRVTDALLEPPASDPGPPEGTSEKRSSPRDQS